MNWKIALLVALVAAPGPVAVSWLALPALINESNLPVPIETLRIATAAQGIVLLVIAAFLGALLSTKVGLRAPVASALAAGGDLLSALRPQILPGVVGGFIGAAVIICFYAFAPSELAVALGQKSIPLAARVLYGGITEEVLIRWGLMTLLVWVGWHLFQRGVGDPSAGVFWLAIGLSAILFGASHVPAVAAAMGTVPVSIFAYITIGNALFGVVAGFLFWRYGLEAAIVAHVLAHLIAFIVRG